MTRAHDGSDGRASEIEQQAAEWIVRIDLHGTPENWAALDAWLAANPRHRAAFLRLSVLWKRADRLRELMPQSGWVDADLLDPRRDKDEPADDEVLVGQVIAFEKRLPEKRAAAELAWAEARSYRAGRDGDNDTAANDQNAALKGRFRTFVTSRIAAAVALFAVVLGAAAGWYALDRSRGDVYSTQVGEFHRVTLADGSTIALNTNSKVRVHFTANLRHIDLIRGEALFEVAKNKKRPFDVEAGSATVRAVGTAFSVRLHNETKEERVDVVVSEGRIAINPPSATTYPAGTVAIVRNGRIEATTLSSEDISGRLAWTAGRLFLQGEKLRDVVAEINRYNLRQLEVTDPDISGLRIGGRFNVSDPEGFVRALESTFGIKSRIGSDGETIELHSGVP